VADDDPVRRHAERDPLGLLGVAHRALVGVRRDRRAGRVAE
jgi:hypothetical protein